MSSKSEQLKQISAEKKVLADKQKALREELNVNRDERIALKKELATHRANVLHNKKLLANLCVSVRDTMKEGDAEQLASDITRTATALSDNLANFSKTNEALNNL